MLLLGENNPRMGFALGETFRMQTAIISDIETVERPPLSGCPEQVLLVLSLERPG